MVTREQIEGQWKQIKGQIQEKWGQLTDSELNQAKGNVNQLVGVIQQRTGASKDSVEDFFEQLMADGSSMFEKASEAAKHYSDAATERVQKFAGQASQTAREQYDRANEQLQETYGQAQEIVRSKPVESIAVAFGAGIITGVVVGLVLRNRG